MWKADAEFSGFSGITFEMLRYWRNEAASILKNALFKDAVDLDSMRSLEIDPQYVPSALLNGELLENPQEYKLYEQLMSQHGVKRR